MNGWTKTSLGECCEIVSGATPNTSVSGYWDGDVCWATPKDLSELTGHFISDTPRKLTQAGLASCSATILPPNSVLFSSRAPIGYVAINTVPMATNQGFKSLVPRRGAVDAKFLFHWLRANRTYLEGLGVGATFKEVSKSVVSRVELSLPPLAEQRHIAEVLDNADSVRAKRRDALARLDHLEHAIFLEMFGDLASGHQALKTVPLADLAEGGLQNGAYFPKEMYSPAGTEMVHMSDAFGGVVKRGSLRRVLCSESEADKYRLRETDLLIARRSLTYEGAAKPCQVPPSAEPLLFESSFIRLRPDLSRVTTTYLFHYLNHERVREKYVRPYVTQSTISGINQSNLARVPVVLPPMEMQRKFELTMRRADELRDASRRSARELDKLFVALESRAFLGKLGTHKQAADTFV